MKKGITPVITIIILVFIAIAMVGSFWTFSQTWITGLTSKTFEIPPGGAFCESGLVKVYLLNTAQGALTSGDIVLAQVNGQTANQGLIHGMPIAQGKTGLVINHTCIGTPDEISGCGSPTPPPAGQGCCKGSAYYSVRIGSSSNFKTESVFCP